VFEAKKTEFCRRTFAVNCCGKKNKKFFHFFDFSLALSALLGENLRHFDGLAVAGTATDFSVGHRGARSLN